MRYSDLVYNEIKDIHSVDQFGYVDLVECLSNGVVPDSISDTEVEYNEIEDPSTIMGKPSDVFEAYRMQDYIKANGTIKDESTE